MQPKMLRQLSNAEIDKFLGKEITGEFRAQLSKEAERRSNKKLKKGKNGKKEN